ncbi:MAG: carbohydrate kinase family protein [Eubacteriales bacterium]|nr:carbohydrate kinase family protein [Eubacteriales bacterium]MDY4899004.1 carbohydrate kinase family protein [Eubacteriales bacterium]
MKKRGIICAGSIIADQLKRLDAYPAPSTLANISELSLAPGGLVCNCIQDLARMDPELPLYAAGLVGDDQQGRFILDVLSAYENIDVSGIKISGQTSFTDVMYEKQNNTRTFFQFAGANENFDESCLELDDYEGLLHIGYILLLKALDAPDAEYGTKLARLLAGAKERGLKTSVDIVSENSTRFRGIVMPALKYTDYCIINELEAERTTGIQLSGDSGIIEDNLPAVFRALRECGVSEWVVIHSKLASYGVDAQGNYVKATVYGVPREAIASTTGAGDAFCSGVLLGAFRGYTLDAAMKLGTLAANCSLLTAGASDGISEIAEMEKQAAAWSQPEIRVGKISL